MMRYKGTIFLEILVKKGSIKNLGRPKNFIKIKENFLR